MASSGLTAAQSARLGSDSLLTMKKVLVAGEINPDLILQGYHSFPEPGKEVLVDDFVMALGSASAICAMGLARLGRPVAFVGKVGDDPWGEFCVGTMSRGGIDVSRVRRDPGAEDRRDRLHLFAARSRARLVRRRHGRPARRRPARLDLRRVRPPPRVVLFPAVGAPRVAARRVPARTRGGPDHVARSRLRPHRALVARPARRAGRRGRVPAQRGGAGGAGRRWRSRRRRWPGSTTGARGSWPSSGRAGA